MRSHISHGRDNERNRRDDGAYEHDSLGGGCGEPGAADARCLSSGPVNAVWCLPN